MSGDHNQYQKGRRWKIRKSGDDLLVCFDYTGTSEDKHIRFVKAEQQSDFECPRCGHCCQALETEKEEPVAWRSTSPDGKLSNKFVGTSVEVNWTPIYTDPPKREWAGLTEREVEECTIAAERDYERYMHATRGQQLGQRDQLDWWIARAIETKLKEKNT